MKQTSKKPGALPAYIQISEVVARRINAGQILVGERLPSERVMAIEFGVAVGTLRKALCELQSQGFLIRKHGSGNYIKKVTDATNVYSFFSLESIVGAGLPTAQMISISRQKKPLNTPYFGPDQEAFCFRRLRFLDDCPAALEEIWLDGSVASTLDQQEISESLYHTYQSRFGFWIVRAEDHVSFSSVPDWGVDQFGLKPGDTAGYVERIAWANTGTALEFSRSWYDPKVAKYVARIK